MFIPVYLFYYQASETVANEDDRSLARIVGPPFVFEGI
jgi:hypothetical protein